MCLNNILCLTFFQLKQTKQRHQKSLGAACVAAATLVSGRWRKGLEAPELNNWFNDVKLYVKLLVVCLGLEDSHDFQLSDYHKEMNPWMILLKMLFFDLNGLCWFISFTSTLVYCRASDVKLEIQQLSTYRIAWSLWHQLIAGQTGDLVWMQTSPNCLVVTDWSLHTVCNSKQKSSPSAHRWTKALVSVRRCSTSWATAQVRRHGSINKLKDANDIQWSWFTYTWRMFC